MAQPPIQPYQPPTPPTKSKRSRGKLILIWAGAAFGAFLLLGGILNAAGVGKKTDTAAPAPVHSTATVSVTPAATRAMRASTAPAKPSPTRTAAAAAKTNAAASIGILTAFGATESAWDAHHTADPNTSGGFNASSALQPTTTGGVNDAYSGVTFTGTPGRVLAYQMLFTSRSLSGAEAKVLAELPKDAVAGSPVVQMHGLAGAQCVGVTYTSATLGRILGGKDSGTVDVEYASANADQLHESAIEWATLADRASEVASGISLSSPC